MLYKLLKHSDRRRFDNRIVSLMPLGPIGYKARSIGIPVQSLDMKTNIISTLKLFKLRKWLKETKPTIVQTWLYHADLVGLVVCFGRHTSKLVWNLRCSNMDLDSYRKTTSWARTLCARFSEYPDAVITNASFARDYHLHLGYHPKRFDVIPNGFDLESFKPDPDAGKAVRSELGIPQDAAVVGFIARLDPMKDIKTFFSALNIVSKEMRDVYVIIAGSGMERHNPFIARLVQRLNPSLSINLLGLREDIPRVLNGCDLLVSSSIGEGFSNVIGEAMACAVPCVVTDVGDSAYLVGDTGIVVQPRQPSALAKAMVSFFNLPLSQRRAMGIAARDRIGANFTIKKIVRSYENFYYRLL